MKRILISILKYTLSLAIAILLLWYVFKDIDWSKMQQDLQNADYKWVLASIVISLISHLLRSLRWNLILQPLGYSPKVSNTFVAVMVGYLANFVYPRLGEVTRCGILHRIEKIPFKTSIGTVIAERAFDLITLLFLIGVTLLFEFDRLSGLFAGVFTEIIKGIERNLQQFYLFIIIFILAVVIVIVLAILYKKKIRRTLIYVKVMRFWQGIVEGFLSILRLKNKWRFLLYTFLMWFLYYLMTYTFFFALESTSRLGPLASITILVVGSIGMTAPVPGGIGAFHLFVAKALELYGLPFDDGKAFATLYHTSQFITVALTGSVCFIISIIIAKKLKKI
ncbi:MAG: flippase-like domain-containing protein [Cytophagales bacterium]|nr:flippase-like domain-containing protein [Cytophagales bacterium]